MEYFERVSRQTVGIHKSEFPTTCFPYRSSFSMMQRGQHTLNLSLIHMDTSEPKPIS